ncbi:hypothetical protein AG1IA_06041 [Rhizoctonia solani AG-1 IA]|uniref:Uncharacterized protein n=1 Tax=Thanatephorus cucumeris (strain AG1-IA) TaxID=983506 RepID=L8WT53_THACA|nr:hypothetical protein AG1IA_06041 [Rhizoctonia solani AG-1 IA]
MYNRTETPLLAMFTMLTLWASTGLLYTGFFLCTYIVVPLIGEYNCVTAKNESKIALVHHVLSAGDFQVDHSTRDFSEVSFTYRSLVNTNVDGDCVAETMTIRKTLDCCGSKVKTGIREFPPEPCKVNRART